MTSSATRVMQLGRESTAGTAVAATTIWRGKGSMENLQEVTPVEEDIGQYANELRAYIANAGAQVVMESTPATFEQLLHILEAGVQTVTPSGTESPYTYSYSFPADTNSEPTIKTYTIEYGDSEDNDEAEYCFVESFELSGAADEAVMMSATWRGRQMSATARTGSLTLPSVEEILFNKGALYIDDSGGSVGSTQVSNSLLAFTLSVTTGWKAQPTSDGNLYFTFAKLTKPEITLSVTAEHTSDWDSAGEKAKWDGSTVRLYRLQFTGTSSRQLTIDAAGIYTSFSSIGDQDGDSILDAELMVGHSSDDSLHCDIEVKCALASVP